MTLGGDFELTHEPAERQFSVLRLQTVLERFLPERAVIRAVVSGTGLTMG